MNQVSNQPTFFVQADRFMERVPIASTLSSIVKIFIKCVLCCIPQETIQKNRYFSYVNAQSNIRIMTLLIPVIGNLIVWLHDLPDPQNIPPELKKSFVSNSTHENPRASTGWNTNCSGTSIDAMPSISTSAQSQMTASEAYQAANLKAKNKQYSDAFKLYQTASSLGDKRAIFRLAKYYEKGKGMEHLSSAHQSERLRKTHAELLYKEAAKKGHVEAALVLADRALKANKFEKVDKWLTIAGISHLTQSFEVFKQSNRSESRRNLMISFIHAHISKEKNLRKLKIGVSGCD